MQCEIDLLAPFYWWGLGTLLLCCLIHRDAPEKQ
jgi:hypothetical protein